MTATLPALDQLEAKAAKLGTSLHIRHGDHKPTVAELYDASDVLLQVPALLDCARALKQAEPVLKGLIPYSPEYEAAAKALQMLESGE